MHRLADFIARTIVAAHEARVTIGDFARENALKLASAEEHLDPHCSFTLTQPGRPAFLFYVELDNSTELLTAPTQRDSWLKRLHFYVALRQRDRTARVQTEANRCESTSYRQASV